MDLNNKVVLLTGASSGIGYCLAKSLPKENCSLALISRRKNILDELVSELNNWGKLKIDQEAGFDHQGHSWTNRMDEWLLLCGGCIEDIVAIINNKPGTRQ